MCRDKNKESLVSTSHHESFYLQSHIDYYATVLHRYPKFPLRQVNWLWHIISLQWRFNVRYPCIWKSMHMNIADLPILFFFSAEANASKLLIFYKLQEQWKQVLCPNVKTIRADLVIVWSHPCSKVYFLSWWKRVGEQAWFCYTPLKRVFSCYTTFLMKQPLNYKLSNMWQNFELHKSLLRDMAFLDFTMNNTFISLCY